MRLLSKIQKNRRRGPTGSEAANHSGMSPIIIVKVEYFVTRSVVVFCDVLFATVPPVSLGGGERRSEFR